MSESIISNGQNWQIDLAKQIQIDKKLLSYYEYIIRFLINNFGKALLEDLSSLNLLKEFLKYCQKYLSISSNTIIQDVAYGSLTIAIRVGDYIIKCSDGKYCSEVCPNLYLIIKNLEEVIKVDNYGHIRGILEVQKYLKNNLANEENAKGLSEEWLRSLDEEGYYYADHLYDGRFGSNAFLLDDYHEANTNEPERLPEWFKKKPVVLVDRDLVLKKVNK